MLEQVQSPVVLHMNRGLITFLNLKTIPYRKIYNIRIINLPHLFFRKGHWSAPLLYLQLLFSFPSTAHFPYLPHQIYSSASNYLH